jgi:hypothetical protein
MLWCFGTRIEFITENLLNLARESHKAPQAGTDAESYSVFGLRCHIFKNLSTLCAVHYTNIASALGPRYASLATVF